MVCMNTLIDVVTWFHRVAWRFAPSLAPDKSRAIPVSMNSDSEAEHHELDVSSRLIRLHKRLNPKKILVSERCSYKKLSATKLPTLFL